MYVIPSDVPIYQDFIPASNNNNPGLPMTPKGITIHQTGNNRAGANARAHANYVKGAAAAAIPASWHFTVDDKEIWQHLHTNRVSWHAGDGYNGYGNRNTISIEICINRDGNLNKAEANAIWLTVKLLLDTPSIDPLIPGVIYQHFDWSGKNCPAQIRARSNGWQMFVDAVAAEYKRRFNNTDEAGGIALDRVKKMETQINGLLADVASAKRMLDDAREAFTA